MMDSLVTLGVRTASTIGSGNLGPMVACEGCSMNLEEGRIQFLRLSEEFERAVSRDEDTDDISHSPRSQMTAMVESGELGEPKHWREHLLALMQRSQCPWAQIIYALALQDHFPEVASAAATALSDREGKLGVFAQMLLYRLDQRAKAAKVPKMLYRYCGPSDLTLQTLASGKVFFPAPYQLNDPFDCQLSIDSSIEQHELIPYTGSMLLMMGNMGLKPKFGRLSLNLSNPTEDYQRSFDYAAEEFLSAFFDYGIYSLSEHALHPLMWSHYASAYTGFVLAFAVDEPRVDNAGLRIVKVDYRHTVPVHSLKEMLNDNGKLHAAQWDLLMVKGDMWSYENEWRVICYPGKTLRNVPFNVKEVIFGHMCTDSTRLKIRDIFGAEIDYSVAFPDENAFSLSKCSERDGRARVHGAARPHRERFTYFFNKKP